MAYTEIKIKNKKRYYYRTSSVRAGDKIMKKRIYLGVDLSPIELLHKEAEADKKIMYEKVNKSLHLVKDKIIKVLRKYRVKKAGIFGSYARGENKKNSDIDILIEPPKGMGLEFVNLASDLEKSSGKKVDLITYNGIHPLLKKRILKEEVPLYG